MCGVAPDTEGLHRVTRSWRCRATALSRYGSGGDVVRRWRRGYSTGNSGADVCSRERKISALESRSLTSGAFAGIMRALSHALRTHTSWRALSRYAARSDVTLRALHRAEDSPLPPRWLAGDAVGVGGCGLIRASGRAGGECVPPASRAAACSRAGTRQCPGARAIAVDTVCGFASADLLSSAASRQRTCA